ncbi:MAG TPA: hypothetical protein VKR58_12010 [Aquella sp.]|nr:hypothetical protein [Aquella sp.]
MIRNICGYIQDYANKNTLKFVIAVLVFGITLGLGTNKIFGTLVDRYTEVQFSKLEVYEQNNDRRLDGIDQRIQNLSTSVGDLNYSLSSDSGKLDSVSNQLDIISDQIYQSSKIIYKRNMRNMSRGKLVAPSTPKLTHKTKK